MLRLLCTGFLLTLAGVAAAQTCGRTDTIAIANAGATEVTISIADYLNNDLADPAQGLCGVRLYFSQSYVYDLVVSLTSPAGQSIDLIGPNNDQTRPPTAGTRWFVDWAPCATPPQPRPGAPARWNNNDPYEWPAFAVDTGVYHPATGCLEDFDRGAVNGDWTLRFRNFRANESGRVTYLLLTFCDDRNAQGPCCFADAGELRPEAATQTCVDAPPGPLPPDRVRYRRPRPPADEYAYTYVVARGGRIVATEADGDLTGYPPGDYQICGLSYRRGELANLPTDGTLSPDELRLDLDAVRPRLCADLTDDCRAVTLFPVPDTVRLTETICTNDRFRVGDQDYATTGVFTTDLTARGGCDSVVVLDLSVVSTLRQTVDTTVCFGGGYAQAGAVYTTDGTYVDTLTSRAGCDSIVTVNLTVAAAIITDLDTAICAGDTFHIGPEAFAETTTVSRVIAAANGCDSTVNLDLVVLDPRIVVADGPRNLTCDDPVRRLDATASEFDFAATIAWYDSLGNRVGTDLLLDVAAAGTYVFELTDGVRGARCTVRDTLRVTDDRFTIQTDLAGTREPGSGDNDPLSLDCSSPSLELALEATPPRAGYVYRWSAPGAGTDSLLTVRQAGVYAVTVTDTATGCSAADSATVTLDTLRPRATITGLELLNCAVPELRLAADSTQPRAAELDYAWTAACGPTTTAGPTRRLDCPGPLTLTVTNRTNGCVARRDTVVRQDRAVPTLNLAPAAPPLSCAEPTRRLEPTGVTSANPLALAWRPAADSAVLSTARAYVTERAGRFTLTATDTVSRCTTTATIEVPADTLRPVADAGADTFTLNCYTPSHRLGSDATSRGPDFRYGWVQISEPRDTLGRTPELTVSDPGGYFRLTVTDRGNGCVAQDSVRVLLALDTPFVRLDLPRDFDCFMDSVEVSADRTGRPFPNRQEWSGPCVLTDPDSSRAWVGCTGTYAYTITNLTTGCRDSGAVTVRVADNSVVAVLPDSAILDCETGTATLDRSRSSVAATYDWFRDGQPVALSGPRPVVTVPGTYTLVAGNFDGSCRDTATTIVAVNCPVFAAIVPPDSLVCRNNTVVQLDARPSVPAPGANVTVAWLPPPGAAFVAGAGPRQLTVFTPGRYGFVVTSALSGERDTAFVDVVRNTELPLAEAGPPDTLTCRRPSITLSARGGDHGPRFGYVWSSSSVDTLGTAATVAVTQPGNYFLQLTNLGTGCSRTDNVIIERDVFVPDLTFSSRSLPCDTVDFPLAVTPDVAGDYRYAWSGPAVIADDTTATIRLAAAGEYGVTVTNQDNGCPVTAVATVAREPCPPFPALVDTLLTCRDDSILLVPTFRDPCGNCTYRWRYEGARLADETGPVLLATRVGNYEVEVTNEFGLVARAAAFVGEARVVPASNAGPDRALSCDSTSVRLGAPTDIIRFRFSYRWLDAAGADLGGREPTFRASRGGLYQLETINTFSGCSARDSVRVTYDTLAPRADAGPARILTCDEPRQVLDGLNSDRGSDFAYAWSGGPAALCLRGAESLNPIARCAGTYTLRVTDRRNGCFATSAVAVVGDDELPLLVPLADTTVNCYRDTVVLHGNPPTGPQRSFDWYRVTRAGETRLPTAAGGQLVVTGRGNYRFRARNTATGCSNEFDVGVEEDFRPPTADAGRPDTLYCELDSLRLRGNGQTADGGPVSYRWTSRTGFQVSRAGQSVPAVFQPDVYYLTTQDAANGCSRTDSVTIFRDTEAPLVFAGSDTTLNCARRRLRLMGGAVTVSGRVNYAWSTRNGRLLADSAAADPLVGAAGNYLLVATDPGNDCSSGDLVRVTEDTLRPRAAITAGVPELNCNLPTKPLAVQLDPAPGRTYHYRWSGPPGAPPLGSITGRRVTVVAGGRYGVTVTDRASGCRDSADLVVRENFAPPTVAIAPPDELSCARDTVWLRTNDTLPAYRFTWLGPAGQALATGPRLRVGRADRYRLRTVDLRNGCADTTAVNVVRNETLPIVRLAPPEVLNCDRSTTLLDARGSSRGDRFLLRWSSPGGAGQPLPGDPYRLRAARPGTYVLRIRDRDNGCSRADSVVVEQRAIAVGGLDIAVTQPACDLDRTGSLTVLGVDGGTGPYRYRLNGGLLTDRLVYDDLPVGDYRIEVRDADGCTAERRFTLRPGRRLSVDLRPDTTIRLGDSIPLTFRLNTTSWDTLLWTSEGPLPPRHSRGPLTVRPLSSQNYRLEVIDGDGCRASDEVFIEVDESVNLFVPSAFSPDGDGNNDRFRPFPGPQVARIRELRIFDRWGEQVYDLATDPGRDGEDYGWDGRLDGRLLNPAVFVYRIRVELVDGTLEWYTGDVTLLR